MAISANRVPRTSIVPVRVDAVRGTAGWRDRARGRSGADGRRRSEPRRDSGCNGLVRRRPPLAKPPGAVRATAEHISDRPPFFSGMADIPKIIDVRDDLDRAQEAADADLSGEIEAVGDLLEELVREPAGDREGILDRIDNELLGLEARIDSDDASEHLQSARNRLELFRDAFGDADTDLVITTTRLEPDSHTTDQGTDVATLQGQQIRLELTIANVDGSATGRPTVAFYDDGNAEVGRFTADPVEFDGGEQRTISLDVGVPSEATQYTTSVETAPVG